MKWVRYEHKGQKSYGFIMGNLVRQIEGMPYENANETGVEVALQEVRLLAPCQPSKIICIGLNYLDHVKEMNWELPKEPALFLKPPTTVIGPGEEIIYPALTQNMHYEGELAFVVKAECWQVKQEDAKKYIFGATCANDVTARDLQRTDVQWTRGKSFDTFCPLGPYIETDFNFEHAAIKTLLNGKVVQQSNIDQLIFGVPSIMEYVSAVMTLLPGDVILTGTTSGVGSLQKGDKVAVEIEGVGTLSNIVK